MINHIDYNGFLSGANTFVTSKGIKTGKEFPTILAFICFFPKLDSACLKVTGISNISFTLLIPIGFFYTVKT